MADTKISALPASTTPLAGTEVLPIVQSSATKQVSVANLTAGRSFDALGMVLTSTDAGAAAAPLLDLYRNSASPAASDTIGEIEFNGQDSAGNKQQYALIHGSILSPTSTAETGQIHFETATGGASTEKMIIGTTNLVINDIGAVFNVRIEGDTDANLFFTDATNSRVGIGIITPAEKLDVVGKIKVSDNIVIGTSGKGIDFSATAGSGTSELLADYEEGTWTPTIVGLTTAGTGTYSAQIGYYTKTGRQVTVYGRVGITNHTGTGNMAIGNLPYPLELSYAPGSIIAINLTVNANSYPVILMVGLNSTIIYIEQVATATGASASVPMDTSCDLYFSITYFAAS
jgi:hypothetical protein